MGNPAACVSCMGAEPSKPIAHISWLLVFFIMYTPSHGAPKTSGMILQSLFSDVVIVIKEVRVLAVCWLRVSLLNGNFSNRNYDTPRTLTPMSQCQLRKEMINTCKKVKSIEG